VPAAFIDAMIAQAMSGVSRIAAAAVPAEAVNG
jgi:hypothetical protein